MKQTYIVIYKILLFLIQIKFYLNFIIRRKCIKYY